MPHKPFHPLTDEESRVAAELRLYAIAVAFDRAARPVRDPNDIISIGHDAAILAARYYLPGKGHKNIQSFTVSLVIQGLHRLYHPRRRTIPLDQIAQVKPMTCCDGCGAGCLEINDLIAKILATASEKERKLIHEYFWQQKTYNEIARGKTKWSVGCQLKKCLGRFREQFKDRV